MTIWCIPYDIEDLWQRQIAFIIWPLLPILLITSAHCTFYTAKYFPFLSFYPFNTVQLNWNTRKKTINLANKHLTFFPKKEKTFITKMTLIQLKIISKCVYINVWVCDYLWPCQSILHLTNHPTNKTELSTKRDIHARHQLNDETFGYHKRVIVTPAIYPHLQIFQSDNI